MDKKSVYTILGDVVSRLRQWGSVERGRGRCGGVQVRTWPDPPVATLTKFTYLVNKKFVNIFLPHYKLSLTFLTTFGPTFC
jgi:hypothetical protein